MFYDLLIKIRGGYNIIANIYLNNIVSEWINDIENNNKNFNVPLNSRQYYQLTELCDAISEDKTIFGLDTFLIALAFDYFIKNNSYDEIEAMIKEGVISCHL